jgi:hypothetical protein
MKRFLTIFAVLLTCITAKSQHVDDQLARKVAEKYYDRETNDSIKVSHRALASKSTGEKLKVKRNFTKMFNGQVSYYINNIEGGGWVIVSADKKTGPVLAYSEFGYYNPDSLPDAIFDWMAQYDTIIEKSRLKDTVIEKKVEKWNKYENEKYSRLKSGSSTQVGPLIETTWHQLPPYNDAINKFSTYNTGCCIPYNTRCYAGCSSIAISQIVNYWGFSKGDNADFEFWNMPNSLNYLSPQIEKDATCYMIKTIGTERLHSDYCYQGYVTTSTLDRTASAFQELGYSAGVYYGMQGVYDIIKSSIDAKCPVDYRYRGEHEFICDGYNSSTGKLHFNMGWNNQYNALWWNIDELTDTSHFDYTNLSKHNFFSSIHPIIEATQELKGITLNNGDNKTYQTDISLIANTLILNLGAKCQLIAGGAVCLEPGFWAKPGSRLTAKAYSKDVLYYASLKSARINDSSSEPTEISDISKNNSDIIVFPNPATDKLNIETSTIGKCKYQMYDFIGNLILVGNFKSQMETISLKNYHPGPYVLKIFFNNKLYHFKIVHN